MTSGVVRGVVRGVVCGVANGELSEDEIRRGKLLNGKLLNGDLCVVGNLVKFIETLIKCHNIIINHY